jgi:hypothetical protein
VAAVVVARTFARPAAPAPRLRLATAVQAVKVSLSSRPGKAVTMRKLLSLTALSLFLGFGPAAAQSLPQKTWTLQSPILDLGDYQCTSVSAAKTLYSCAGLSAIPANAVFAVVQVEGNAARWRCDGTAPTASVGQPLAVSTPIYFSCGKLGDTLLKDVQLIPQTGSMTMDVSFFGVQ